MEQLKILCSNYLINVGFFSWCSAQVLKTLLVFLETNKFEAERLVGAGGMPSAHSALVCSITVGMARQMGFSSPEFALALTFAGIVMYDAMGVRRAAGEQAKVLNRMMKHDKLQGGLWNKSAPLDGIDTPSEVVTHIVHGVEKDLKEFLGHTPLEVLGGALLGILVAMIVPPFR